MLIRNNTITLVYEVEWVLIYIKCALIRNFRQQPIGVHQLEETVKQQTYVL